MNNDQLRDLALKQAAEKRAERVEAAAVLALQGILSNPETSLVYKSAADKATMAVSAANALITQLDALKR